MFCELSVIMNAGVARRIHVWGCVLMACVSVVLTGYNRNLPEYRPDEQNCPSDTDRSMDNIQRPWGEADRAFNTLPKGLVIKNSTLPKAGRGVFTYVFIPRFTWLGEYEGEIVDSGHISEYAWTANRDGEADYYIDGAMVETSSWQRFVNCPNHNSYENVVIHECRGRVYYMASRDIYPAEELFVYYGEKYALYLGIDVRKYHSDLPPEWTDSVHMDGLI